MIERQPPPSSEDMSAFLMRAGVPHSVFFYIVLGGISSARKLMIKSVMLTGTLVEGKRVFQVEQTPPDLIFPVVPEITFEMGPEAEVDEEESSSSFEEMPELLFEPSEAPTAPLPEPQTPQEPPSEHTAEPENKPLRSTTRNILGVFHSSKNKPRNEEGEM